MPSSPLLPASSARDSGLVAPARSDSPLIVPSSPLPIPIGTSRNTEPSATGARLTSSSLLGSIPNDLKSGSFAIFWATRRLVSAGMLSQLAGSPPYFATIAAPLGPNIVAFAGAALACAAGAATAAGAAGSATTGGATWACCLWAYTAACWASRSCCTMACWRSRSRCSFSACALNDQYAIASWLGAIVTF